MTNSFRRTSLDGVRRLVVLWILLAGCVTAAGASHANDPHPQGLVDHVLGQRGDDPMSRGLSSLPGDSRAHLSELGGATWWNTVLDRWAREVKTARCEDGTCRAHLADPGTGPAGP